MKKPKPHSNTGRARRPEQGFARRNGADYVLRLVLEVLPNCHWVAVHQVFPDGGELKYHLPAGRAEAAGAALRQRPTTPGPIARLRPAPGLFETGFLIRLDCSWGCGFVVVGSDHIQAFDEEAVALVHSLTRQLCEYWTSQAA